MVAAGPLPQVRGIRCGTAPDKLGDGGTFAAQWRRSGSGGGRIRPPAGWIRRRWPCGVPWRTDPRVPLRWRRIRGSAGLFGRLQGVVVQLVSPSPRQVCLTAFRPPLPVSVEVLGRCPRWSSVLGRQPCWWWRRRRGGGGVAAASAVGGGTHSVSSPSAVCYMLRGGPHRRKPCRIYRHDDGGAFGRRSPPWRRHLGVSHLLGRLHWASAASWWRGRQWLAWWRRWRRGGVTACCQVGAPVAPWWCGWGSWLLGQEVGARVVAGHGQWRRGVVAARHDSDGKVHIEVPIRQGEEMAKVFYGISEASCLALLGQLKFWQWRDDGEAAEWLGCSISPPTTEKARDLRDPRSSFRVVLRSMSQSDALVAIVFLEIRDPGWSFVCWVCLVRLGTLLCFCLSLVVAGRSVTKCASLGVDRTFWPCCRS